MKLKKGSAAAKAYMAKIRGMKKKAKPAKKTSVAGYVKTIRKGSATNVLYSNAAALKKAPAKQKQGTLFGSKKYPALGASGYFDVQAINDLDALKKQYFKLAKLYHPDAGGTKEQFQSLQNEYEVLQEKILRGSNLTDSQKTNEREIDAALRDVCNVLVTIPGINIEIIGKWIWVSGNTYPVRTELKAAGLTFIKKNNLPYWIYKGVESASRGKMDIDEIRAKYGSQKMTATERKKIQGIGAVGVSVTAAKRNKLKTALRKLVKAINKRPK